jgi:hypothetical protein
MKIETHEKYVKYLEHSLIIASVNIMKSKLFGRFITMKYDDIQKLTSKYLDGKMIRQASFHKEKSLTGYEKRILHAGKIAMNHNRTFVYESDIVAKIKSGDKSILAKVIGKNA